jgi:hypothetical protein
MQCAVHRKIASGDKSFGDAKENIFQVCVLLCEGLYADAGMDQGEQDFRLIIESPIIIHPDYFVDKFDGADIRDAL